MLLRIDKWKNADYYSLVKIYECDMCKEEFNESNYHYLCEDGDFCYECAFKKELVTEKQFLRFLGLHSPQFQHAGYHNGELHVWSGDIKPWEHDNRYYRRTSAYRKWRKNVLERDNHMCKHCGTDTDLQAHHIKPFSTNKKLRYVVSNGLTLCKTCHRKEHKRLNAMKVKKKKGG